MTSRLPAVVAAAAACAAALYVALSPPTAVVAVGRPAPGFTLAGLSGRTVSLSDYRGKVVLLNFWASWCPDCRGEFPALESVYERRRAEGFELVAPSLDAGGRGAVLPFLAQASPTFMICLADPQTARAYGVRELPTSFLIGADGVVLKRYVGAVTPDELENDILKQIPRRRS